MNINIKHERNNTSEKIIFEGKTLKELLQQLTINPETVIVVKNNTVITEDELLNNNDLLEILSVVSGG